MHRPGPASGLGSRPAFPEAGRTHRPAKQGTERPGHEGGWRGTQGEARRRLGGEKRGYMPEFQRMLETTRQNPTETSEGFSQTGDGSCRNQGFDSGFLPQNKSNGREVGRETETQGPEDTNQESRETLKKDPGSPKVKPLNSRFRAIL